MKAQIKKVDNGRLETYFPAPTVQAWDVEVDGVIVTVMERSERVDAGNENGDYILRSTGKLAVHNAEGYGMSNADAPISDEMADAARAVVRQWQAGQ